MRKILTLFILFSIVIACSDGDSPTEQNNLEFPTNITLSTQVIGIGEILTINGNGFLVNETYIVTFSDNVTGNITEINADNLKVEVPQNAMSGNITLTFNNELNVIGNITINTPFSARLFAYKDQVTPSQIIEIDRATGNEISVIADINHSNYLADFNFDSSTNEIICDYTDNNVKYLYKINVDTGQTTSVQSNPATGRYENWIISNDNRLFAYKDQVTPSQIVEIDRATGNEISVIADINHSNYLADFNFDSSTNEIICDYTDNNVKYLYKINVDTGQTTSVQSNSATGRYENWIMSDDNRLFAYKDQITPSQIIEIDKATGNEISVIADINHSNYLADFNFDSSTNEIICDYTDNNVKYLYKINVDTGQTTSVQSNPETGRYENWIMNKEQ